MALFPRIIRQTIKFCDRWFVPLLGLVAACVMALQYGQRPDGLMPYYRDFRNIILAGFDPRVARAGCPTFPMWGYGWLLILTQNKFAMLLFQNALAILALWGFLRVMQRCLSLSASAMSTIKAMSVISLPWHAYNSVANPRSVAVSLFLLSFALLCSMERKQGCVSWRACVSGFLFGLMLNFRSDYYLMPLGLAFLLTLLERFSRRSMCLAIIWLCCTYVTLIPWALYTTRVTGSTYLTNTNGGHVLFIGLGNRPGNRWGITPRDDDPEMARIVKEHCGEDKHSCGHEADRVLKREWLRRVREHPWEYMLGSFYRLRSMVIGGVYSGNFDPSFGRRMQELLREKSLAEISSEHPFVFMDYLSVRVVLNLVSELIGRIVVALAFMGFPFVVYGALRKRDVCALLISAAIAYQWAINMFAYNMRNYMTNMYVLYLVTIVLAARELRACLTSCSTQGKEEGDAASEAGPLEEGTA